MKPYRIVVLIAHPVCAGENLRVTHFVELEPNPDSAVAYAEMEAIAVSLGGTLATYDEVVRRAPATPRLPGSGEGVPRSWTYVVTRKPYGRKTAQPLFACATRSQALSEVKQLRAKDVGHQRTYAIRRLPLLPHEDVR